MKYRIIKCKGCGQRKKHYAKDLCEKCYDREHSRKYYHTSKGRKVHKKAMKKYSKTEKGKEVLEKYNNSKKGKETRRKYQHSQKYKETRKKYLHSPKGREVRRKIAKNYRLTPKGKGISRKSAKNYSKTRQGKITRMRAKLKYRKKFPINLSFSDAEFIKKRDKMRCVYCGVEVFEHPKVPNYHSQLLTFDHIDSNGASDISNLVVACYTCNRSKHDKNVFEWCKEKERPVPNIILQMLN